MNDNRMYCIHLEDYAYPRKYSVLRAYIGRKSEIMELMERLSANSQTALRYNEMITAINVHESDPNVNHHMAGQKIKVLESVQVLYTKKIRLEPFVWHHRRYGGESIPAKCNVLEVEQMLVQLGEQLIRCAKLHFEDLSVCYPYLGWLMPRSNIFGFPGVVQYIEPNRHQSVLFAEMEIYDSTEIIKAIIDTNSIKERDHEVLCDDILGDA